MRTNLLTNMRAGLSIAAAATMLIGGTPAALAAGNGATVTDASGPSYLYGDDNPLAGVDLDIHGVQTPSGKTVISLVATGFASAFVGRTFGAHVHVNSCGLVGSAAGPHYQSTALPGLPVEAREVWLDFTVKPGGTATAHAKRDWVFTTSARSVIVHASATAPSGAAGARLACTNATFHP
jgi:Cu-Zn family superoxide dismutase